MHKAKQCRTKRRTKRVHMGGSLMSCRAEDEKYAYYTTSPQKSKACPRGSPRGSRHRFPFCVACSGCRRPRGTWCPANRTRTRPRATRRLSTTQRSSASPQRLQRTEHQRESPCSWSCSWFAYAVHTVCLYRGCQYCGVQTRVESITPRKYRP